MLRSFDGLAVRQLRTRRLRALLTSFGIVLGVGMVFGVLVLAGTIRHTFDDVIDSALGTKDLVISPRGGMLADDAPAKVRATPGVRDAGAMIGLVVSRMTPDGRTLHGMTNRVYVAGYNPQQPPPYDFRWQEGRAPKSGVEVSVEANWARERHVEVGDLLRVGTPTGPRHIPVVGIFRFSDNLSFGGQGMAAMPENGAREVFGQPTGWMQMSVRLKDRSQVDVVKARLEQLLGRGVRVETPSSAAKQVTSQLDALNVILMFFSGIALFVGGFLILNSFSMTVTQRTRELGMLRTLGATRRMIRRTVLTEALLLGVIGSLLGLGFGLGLAAGLIALIKGVGVPAGSVQVAAPEALIAFVLGLVATAVGAWWPARRAASTSPIVAAQGGRFRPTASRRRVAIGVLMILPGVIWGGALWFDQGADAGAKTLLAIVLTMVMLAGIAVAAPGFITPLVRALSVPLRRIAPTGGRLAADAARRDRTRTAATAVALTIGLSVIVVNAAMSASFIGNVRDQIDRSYARDLTVRQVGATAQDGSNRAVDPTVRAQIAKLPGVGVVSPLRSVVAELPGLPGNQPYGFVRGVDPATWRAVDRSELIGATGEQAMAALRRGEMILGRVYARDHGLRVGDRLTLDTPHGRRSIRIAALKDEFSDFGGSVVYLSNARLAADYGVTGDAELLVRARTAADRDRIGREVTALLDRGHPELEAVSTATIKNEIATEIDRQFTLFNAIVAIAVIVSLLGVVNTLAMSVLERTREIGVLRALGSSRWLVRMTMIDESLLITLSGAIAGVVLGLAIAWNWVRALDSMLPGVTFALPLTVVIGVALAAALLGAVAAALPARRAARIDVVTALGYE